MGTDGAKRVVVNSVGREIRTLEEIPPVEGRRVQLTIDSDLQRAAEDGLPAGGVQRRGAHPRPAQRRGAHLRQPAVVRPQRLRGRHRPRHVGLAQHRQAQAAAEPRAAGPLFARVHLQDRRRHGGARGRAGHARLQGDLHRRRDVLRALLQVPPQGRARHRGHAPRHREVVQRLLLHARQHARRGQDPQVGGEARHGRQDRHRPAERAGEHRALHRVEDEALPARSGTPARRSRCRSARGRWR